MNNERFLREQIDRLQSELSAARAALKLIADYGGRETPDEECVICCNGSWCAEQARSALWQAKAALATPNGGVLAETKEEKEA